MNLSNNTSNQHFVAQVEQRLNTSTPALEKRKQKIFKFEIVTRGTPAEIVLAAPSEPTIKESLALTDLYSFDVVDDVTRHNFEKLFQHFEDGVGRLTASLLEKIATNSNDISEEVVSLFAAKLLNFARNPYAIKKTLNTFGAFTRFRPVEPTSNAMLDRVLNGNKPRLAEYCRDLKVSEQEYLLWLGLLFMMLGEIKAGKPPIFETVARDMFDLNTHAIVVIVGTYTTAKCLLSDRSFSTNQDRSDIDGYDFNLQSNAFIRYGFAHRPELPAQMPSSVADLVRKTYRVEVRHLEDDMRLLRGFNQNVINQSHEHVYCAAATGIEF